jgi:hypothetical protein
MELTEGREPGLGLPLDAGRIFVVAAVLAAVGVVAGTAWHDGLFSGATEVVARRLLKQSWWRLPGALLLGVLVHHFYRDLLDPERAQRHQARVSVVAVVRLFVHFAFFGCLVLFGFMFGGAAMAVNALRGRKTPEGHTTPVERWAGVPLWFLILPFVVMGTKMDGDMTLPATVPQKALLRQWLLAMVPILMMWSGATDEGGDRTDPAWIAAFATYWLGDWLYVALRVVPIMRARRGLSA